MQRGEAEALATLALERFRFLQFYADRKLIAQGRFVEAARRLHRRSRNGLVWSTLLGAWMIWRAIDDVRLGEMFAADFGWGAGVGVSISVAMTALLAVLGLVGVAGAAWSHGRTRELVLSLEALLPEEAPGAEVAAAT